LAQEEAIRFNHTHIGTEHILLGLAQVDEGVAAQALASMGASVGAIRGHVMALKGTGNQAALEHIPFSSRARMVLELAFRVSLELGHKYIGTEHILLGLIREGSGVAIRTLTNMGIDLDNLRRLVLDIISGDPEAEHAPLELDTEQSRRALALAREEAARFNHTHIGTEHILLGLIREGEGIAARVLRSAGVSIEAARGQVVVLAGVGQQASPEQIPLSAQADKALKSALRKAFELGYNRMDTEHILLALIREGDDGAIQTLANMGIDPDNLRRLVLDIISGDPEAEAATT
jgi:ATP-dependent Clp protease ATP-binding subunit ClpA